jgi:hypothetical protein
MKHFVTNTYEKYWYAARVQVNWFDDETPLQGDAPQGFAQGDVIAGRISLPGTTPGNPSRGRMLKGHVTESARDIKASRMLEGRLKKAAD